MDKIKQRKLFIVSEHVIGAIKIFRDLKHWVALVQDTSGLSPKHLLYFRLHRSFVLRGRRGGDWLPGLHGSVISNEG